MKDEIKEKQLKEVLYGLDYIGNKVKNDDAILNLGVNSCKILLDYITNLQERCEYLERSNNRREDEIMSLRNECVDGETYKSRNEKAIEYIKEHIKYECDDTISGMSFYSYHLYDFKKEELLNILNGGDE